MSDSTSIALVTGGNRGIGLAIARALQSEGHRVVITYRSGTPPLGFDAVQMDVTDGQSVESAFAKIENEIGQPEIIVANAGITKDTLVMRMSDEDFESVINANLTGAFRVSKRATKGLLKLKRGRLIFIGSVVGGVGAAGQVNYSASKSGLVGMARSFARRRTQHGFVGARHFTVSGAASGRRLGCAIGAFACHARGRRHSSKFASHARGHPFAAPVCGRQHSNAAAACA